ncbi:MAG: 23S rRNA (pseudouridine(1915)-N(3))-methyltransferase RlmH [Eisenbergiella sp.]
MMTKITLLTVGKLGRFYCRAAAEYQKRLSRYCRLEIIEVADEKTPDGAGAAEEEAVRRKEGERLRKIYP